MVTDTQLKEAARELKLIAPYHELDTFCNAIIIRSCGAEIGDFVVINDSINAISYTETSSEEKSFDSVSDAIKWIVEMARPLSKKSVSVT